MDELQLEGITKGYLGVQALKGVSFSVKRGSIHALAGQNGAGKSTLVKILSGAETPDGGTIRLGGEVMRFKEPTDAQAAGIHTIYQELSLVPSLSVAENIFLGTLPTKGAVVDWNAMQAQARDALARVGFDLDVRQPVSSFSVAEQQAVELAKALHKDARVLLLDEPTSTLPSRTWSGCSPCCAAWRPRASRSSTSRTAWTSCTACAMRSPSCATASPRPT
ncbi:ATP-binding cassette domain-containing protein [Leifsonia xyli]|uniref:ATP-binding cassette domain-containing protein n=1 Tax=Leifsonia xyli TaxID=1575 RepID=UPI003D67621B